MAFKTAASFALLILTLSPFLFTFTNACGYSCTTPPTPTVPAPWVPTPPTPTVPAPWAPTPPTPTVPAPWVPTPPTPTVPAPWVPTPTVPAPWVPTPPTPTVPTPTPNEKCPIDTLKLGVCANVLNGLINIGLGKPPKKPCCTLIQGLTDLQAAVCLCTALKANILGINLNIPIDLSLLINYCRKSVPSGFQCS
ncbi:hypothetical protein LUZ60_014455 [Juncus effusus]|nr:hypothetical protein LUZ60_014455 [Juncus effusus]